MNGKKVISIVLCLLALLSIWPILSIDLRIIPLITCKQSTIFTDGCNRAILSISYSFLAAFVFYIVTILIPHYLAVRHSRKVIAKNVYDLLSELYIEIEIVLFNCNINKNINTITKNEAMSIKNQQHADSASGFYISEKRHKRTKKNFINFKLPSINQFSFPKNFKSFLSHLPQTINNIRKLYPKYTIDENFSEIISCIESSALINIANKNDDIFSYQEFPEELYKLIENFRALYKLNYHSKIMDTILQIECFSQNRIKETFAVYNMLHNVTNFNECCKKLEPIIIYNSEYQNANKIINTMPPLCQSFSTTECTGNIPTILDKSRFIIVIEKGLPRNILNMIPISKDGTIIIHIRAKELLGNKKIYAQFLTKNDYCICYQDTFKIIKHQFFSKYPTAAVLSGIKDIVRKIMIAAYYEIIISNSN